MHIDLEPQQVALREELRDYFAQLVTPEIRDNDLIITNANSYSDSAGAFYLQTGKQKLINNPLTGELQPWKLTRAAVSLLFSASQAEA